MKRLTLIIITLFISCLSLLGIDFTTGNFIPAGAAQSASAGAIIVVNTNGYFDLTPNGDSSMHFVNASLGSTSLEYSSSTSDSWHYSKEMISCVITANEQGTVSGTFSFSNGDYIYSVWGGEYNITYLCVLVKVSGFDSSHDSYSHDYEDWYGDSNNTYTVIGLAYSNSGQTMNFSLNSGECLHIVQVPFSSSNTTYFESSEPYRRSATYTTRYEISFSYTINGVSGTSSDGMNNTGKQTATISSYETLDMGFNPESIEMTISSVLANNSSRANLASSFSMSYTQTNTRQNGYIYITLSPYYSDYRFVNASGNYFDNEFKFYNFAATSSASQVNSDAHSTVIQSLSSTTEVDTADYQTPCFRVTTTVSNREETGTLSFDIYPYITETPSVTSGDYVSTIIAEFSLD